MTSRVARFLRFLLVCLALTSGSAPASAAPVTDTIVLVAAAPKRAVARPAPLPLPAKQARRAPDKAPPSFAPEAPSCAITPREAPRPPRRIYLEHQSLLC